jgi:glycosyltransferase involved in cell wall biosynthesis
MQNRSMNDFSVLMAVYVKDDPTLFERAVKSILHATLLPKEIIIVRDGPVGHGLAAVLDSISVFNQIKIVRLDKNSGLAAALNVGLTHVTTPYVFRADSDDFNLPHRFERQIRVLVEGYDLVGAAILELDQDFRPLAKRYTPSSQTDILNFIKWRNPFNHMTVAFRLDSVLRVGGYPEVHLKEDYALWATMLANSARVCNIEEVLVHATAGRDMYKRRGGWRLVLSEIEMQSLMVRLGLHSICGAILRGTLRSLVLLLPAMLRGIIYERFFRKNI